MEEEIEATMKEESKNMNDQEYNDVLFGVEGDDLT